MKLNGFSTVQKILLFEIYYQKLSQYPQNYRKRTINRKYERNKSLKQIVTTKVDSVTSLVEIKIKPAIKWEH